MFSKVLKIVLCGLVLAWPVNFAQADPGPFSFSVTTSGTQRDTVVTFIGYSSPGAFVTIQEDGAIVGTVSANSAGVFNKTLTDRTAGTHSYGIFSVDNQFRQTPTYGFILNLIPNMETVVSNVLLPTTINVSVGSGVDVFGSSAPNAQITIFVHSDPIVGNAASGTSGNWNFPAGPLDPGTHTAYAQTTLPGGLQSISSNTINFEVNCKIADLDCSGRVDLVDFSILMYYWETTSPTADINSDNIVDLTDFSIMMFYWQG